MALGVGIIVIALLSKQLRGLRDECQVLSFIIKIPSLEPWLYRLVNLPTLSLDEAPKARGL